MSLRVGHLIDESKVNNIPVNEGNLVYLEPSGTQMVDYAGKRHLYGSVIHGVFNEGTFVDFTGKELEEIITAISTNGQLINGQLVKVGNTVYQYRKINGKHMIAKIQSGSTNVNDSNVGYVIYLPEYVAGDTVDMDLLVSVQHNVHGSKVFLVKVHDGKVNLSECQDLDGNFTTDSFILTVAHDGNGMFSISSTTPCMIDVVSCSVYSTGSAVHEQFYVVSGDVRVATEWLLNEVSIPYLFVDGCAVNHNGEIHLLGGDNSLTSHYMWNGTNWVSVSELPYDFADGCAISYRDEIHIFGSSITEHATKHYKWNGTEWVSVSTLPYAFYNGCVVVRTDTIHLLGGTGNLSKHYRLTDTGWVSTSTLGFQLQNGAAVVFNNDIHILGGTTYGTRHYRWNGTGWANVSTLPVAFANGSAVVFRGGIHLFINSNRYRWDGTSWKTVDTLPYSYSNGDVIVHENEIHMLKDEKDYKNIIITV